MTPDHPADMPAWMVEAAVRSAQNLALQYPGLVVNKRSCRVAVPATETVLDDVLSGAPNGPMDAGDLRVVLCHFDMDGNVVRLA